VSWSLERGLRAGGLLAAAGLTGVLAWFVHWHGVGFSAFGADSSLRVVVPSATALIGSCQMVLGTFFLTVLGIRAQPTIPGDSHATAAPSVATGAMSGQEVGDRIRA
jgi:hypothetical protein